MHDLFVSAFDGTTADPVAQSQVLVIVHARGIVAVIANEALQLFAHLRRLGPHALPSCDDLLYLASLQIFGDRMRNARRRPVNDPSGSVDPAVGLLRSFPPKHSWANAQACSNACQKSRISQRFTNRVARFQIHSAPSPTITTTVWAPTHGTR